MELPPLNKDLRQPNRKGPLRCFVCGRPPHSFCSISSPELQGCNRPFCQAHGVVHRGSKFEASILEQSPIEEMKLTELQPKEQVLHADLRRALVLNFSLPPEEEDHVRLCQDCLQREEANLRDQSLLRIAWTSFWILVSLVFLFILVTSLTTSSCGAKSESYCERKDFTASKETLSKPMMIQWVEYREPKVSYCEYWHESQSHGGYDSRYLTCQCMTQKQFRFEVFNNETLKCEKIDCPPNEMGTQYFISWALSFHRCETWRNSGSFETYRDPVNNVSCPSFAKYFPEANLCAKVYCPSDHKIEINGTCKQCPPYLQRRHSLQPQCLFRPSNSQIVYYEYVGIPSGKRPRPCPRLSADEIARNETIKVNMEVRGYAYQIKDVLGYYLCLITNEDTVMRNSQRICVWQEMVVRTLIGCHSPCIECKQKWDFTRKMCVPADDCSSLKDLHLTTWGQCSSKKRWSPLATGEKFCP